MLKYLFIVFVIMILQSSSHASDEFDEEEIEAENPQVADSFPRAYTFAPYPWQQWNFPFYQPRPRNPQQDDDDGGSVPFADPRFVTNRCHSAHSYTTTTYPPYTICNATITTTVTVTITTPIPPTTTETSTTESTTPTTVSTTSGLPAVTSPATV